MKRLHQACTATGLGAAAEGKLARLLRLLDTDPEAPTSVTDPAAAVDVHVADSLAVLSVLADRSTSLGPIADIGSGAGFPGLPLAVACEHRAVDLIESTSRKCRFLERAITELGQANAHVICARAEEWARGDGAGRYELVTVRAVAPLATLLEYASPLLHEHGLLVAWKGARDEREERQAAVAAGMLGMTPSRVHSVTPFADVRHRHLHVFEKTGPTPAGVPRRAGMARKRPFGSERSPSNY